MQSAFKIERSKRSIKAWLLFFMILLVVSGITAIPLERELSIALAMAGENNFIGRWLERVYGAIRKTNEDYHFLLYGYDWLAFAHVVLAIVFLGPYRDPVKNKWIIEWGALVCVLIIPFALIAGYFRGIPLWWRLVDCCFGVFGFIPLGICYKKINRIERLQRLNQRHEN